MDSLCTCSPSEQLSETSDDRSRKETARHVLIACIVIVIASYRIASPTLQRQPGKWKVAQQEQYDGRARDQSNIEKPHRATHAIPRASRHLRELVLGYKLQANHT